MSSDDYVGLCIGREGSTGSIPQSMMCELLKEGFFDVSSPIMYLYFHWDMRVLIEH